MRQQFCSQEVSLSGLPRKKTGQAFEPGPSVGREPFYGLIRTAVEDDEFPNTPVTITITGLETVFVLIV